MRAIRIWFAVSIVALATGAHGIEKKFEWRYPPLNELVVTNYYTQDLGVLLLGSHRLAADIAYIQLLQYYGEEKGNDDSEENEPHYEIRPDGTKYYLDETMVGVFPLLKELGTRYMRLDPFFNQAILEVAGSLAFNQRRIDESLEFLKEAIQRDPSFYRYHLYMAAILYKNTGQDAKLIEVLERAVKDRDCPALFKLVLGNLLKKYKLYERSALVYLEVAETALSESDRKEGTRRLKLLLSQHPEAGRALKQP